VKPTHANTTECTLLQIIVAEHGYKATSSFNFPWQLTDNPTKVSLSTRSKRPRRLSLPSSNEEQLRLPPTTSHPARGECHASEANPAVEEGVDRAPRSRRRPPQETLSRIPPRRLQEGYDVECAAVARPGMERVFTHGRRCWGCDALNRVAASTGVTVARLAPQEPQHRRRLRCRTPACSPPSSLPTIPQKSRREGIDTPAARAAA
jgi:hypothetical protein